MHATAEEKPALTPQQIEKIDEAAGYLKEGLDETEKLLRQLPGDPAAQLKRWEAFMLVVEDICKEAHESRQISDANLAYIRTQKETFSPYVLRIRTTALQHANCPDDKELKRRGDVIHDLGTPLCAGAGWADIFCAVLDPPARDPVVTSANESTKKMGLALSRSEGERLRRLDNALKKFSAKWEKKISTDMDAKDWFAPARELAANLIDAQIDMQECIKRLPTMGKGNSEVFLTEDDIYTIKLANTLLNQKLAEAVEQGEKERKLKYGPKLAKLHEEILHDGNEIKPELALMNQTIALHLNAAKDNGAGVFK